MLNIARNTAIDYIRSADYKNKIKNRTLEKTVYESNNDLQFSENYDHIGLNTVMKKMSAEHQQMIELSYFKGHTHKEISEMLDMPLGTVKTKIRQAMLSLRELIN
jgi:RNA polymerase sigma-70 factor (ECF subfamily)